MIEIGETSKTEMTYDEAVMYCFCLGDGWRLPTKEEYMHDLGFSMSWWKGVSSNNTWYVTPVRDLKDD
jgi:hypothetical protein